MDELVYSWAAVEREVEVRLKTPFELPNLFTYVLRKESDVVMPILNNTPLRVEAEIIYRNLVEEADNWQLTRLYHYWSGSKVVKSYVQANELHIFGEVEPLDLLIVKLEGER